MENKLAIFISYLFHPLLIPPYVMAGMLFSPVFIFSGYPPNLKFMLLAYVFFITFAVPLSMMIIFKKNKIITNLKMEIRQERIIPLTMISIIYYITYYSLNKLGIMNIFSLFMLGSTILTLLALFISFYTKISLHMIGMGGLTGLYLALVLRFPQMNMGPFYLILLLSGLVAYSRMTISNHTVRQLFYGYELGFIVLWAIFIFMPF